VTSGDDAHASEPEPEAEPVSGADGA
jgi:hypothetical protein